MSQAKWSTKAEGVIGWVPCMRVMVFVTGCFFLTATASAALTAPSGLSATNLKATSFTLKWAASTGGSGGIAGYDIHQDGILIGSSATRTFAVAGLAPTTTYSMTVIARDGAGHVSPPSAALPVTTTADTTDPSKPADLAASRVTTASFTLTWTGSTDNVGVTDYNIYRANALVGSTPSTTFDLTGLVPDTNNRMTVRATDAAGNLSAASIALVVRTLADPPSAPIGLTVANLKAASFTLKWTASTGGTGGVSGYYVYKDGVLIGSPTKHSLAITGLTPAATSAMTVASFDAAGNISTPSASLSVTTPADTTKPSVPKDLSASVVAPNSFTLTWMASTDNVGVIGYDVLRNNVLIGSTPTATFNVTGLAPLTTYSMRVKARDAAGNVSGASAVLSVATSTVPNVIPTVTLTEPANGSTFTLPRTLTLSATASDSDGSIARVEFFDGSEKLGEAIVPSTPPFIFTLPVTFSAAGAHALTVRATDNRNATADSEPVSIHLNSPNQSPAVTLTSPVDGASFTAPAFITLTVEASDSDGTIAKVGFYDGSTLLAELVSPSTPPSTFTLPLALVSPGVHVLSAVVTDNTGTQSISTSATVTIVPSAPVYHADFEVADGFSVGPLNGQGGWIASGAGAVSVTNQTAQSGQQSLVVPPPPGANGTYSAHLPLAPVSGDQSVLFYDFWAKPAADDQPYASSSFSFADGATFAFVRTGEFAEVQAYLSNEGAIDQWFSGVFVPVAPDGVAADWLRLTFRQDLTVRKWDLFVDGRLALFDLPFYVGAGSTFNVYGHSTAVTRLDNLLVSFDNPVFADLDRDGMDDAWELAHGLDPLLNDRDGDRDGDGLTNIEEHLLGTDPARADTDGDGLSDGWEVDHGNDPVQPEPASVLNADVDGDGLTFVQEIAAGTNITNPDTDGDGLPDGWEAGYGLNPLSAVDGVRDLDGDGTSNGDEFIAHTNPVDPYNGESPSVVIVTGADGNLGPDGEFSARITTAAGIPLPNAPVEFSITSGAERLVTHPDSGIMHQHITLHSDAQGVVRAYLVQPGQ